MKTRKSKMCGKCANQRMKRPEETRNTQEKIQGKPGKQAGIQCF